MNDYCQLTKPCSHKKSSQQRKLKNVSCLLLALALSHAAISQAEGGYDGPYNPSWLGTWSGVSSAGTSTSTSSSGGSTTSSADSGISSTDSTGVKPIGGKFGGYYYGGGGGPCEAGCDGKVKPKPAAPSKTPAQIALEAEQHRQAVTNAYLALLKNILDTSQTYLSIRGSEWVLNKFVFEWVSKAASSSVFGLYLLIRDGGIADDPLDPPSSAQQAKINDMQKQILKGKLLKLKETQEQDSKNTSKKIPESEFPQDFQAPAFDPTVKTEESIRKKYLKNKELSKEDAKKTVIDFIRKNNGPEIGELTATILEVYDQDKIEKEGLSKEALLWLQDFNTFLKTSYKDRMSIQPVNTCKIPSSKKFCGLTGGKAGDLCHCPQEPNAVGFSSSQQVGNICQTPQHFCELPGAVAWGTKCSCSNGNTYEVGNVKW